MAGAEHLGLDRGEGVDLRQRIRSTPEAGQRPRPVVSGGQHHRIAVGVCCLGGTGQNAIQAFQGFGIMSCGSLIESGERLDLTPCLAQLRPAARSQIGRAVGEDGGEAPVASGEAISRDIVQRADQRQAARLASDIVVPRDLRVPVTDQLLLQFSVHQVELDGEFPCLPAIHRGTARDVYHRCRAGQMVAWGRDDVCQMVFREAGGDGADGRGVGGEPFLQVTQSEVLVSVPPFPLGFGHGRLRQAVLGVCEFLGAFLQVGAQLDDFLPVHRLAMFQHFDLLFQIIAAAHEPPVEPADEQFPRTGDFQDETNDLEHFSAERQVPPMLDHRRQPVEAGDFQQNIGDLAQHGSPSGRSFRAGVRLAETGRRSKIGLVRWGA